ncbi:effector-associated constant component EACC1 [Spirillospora sp. CA-294931]|uniref:effector-associated constant component EACC1 n=1 Tax=Spirillospora sp. CA-294931 TaxID=3240042 RepID=UPI003D8DF768
MELRVSIENGDLAGLYRWLGRDAELAHQSRISLRSAPPAPGELGGTFETINIVLANATALGSLVTAVLTYRDAKKRAAPPGAVRLERNGVVVTIPPESQVAIEQIVSALNAASPPEEGRGPRQ